MLVGPPSGEARQEGEHLVGVGVEDVWAVAVNQHSGVVVVVKRVSGDVRPAVDQQRPLPRLGQLSSQRGAGEACTYDDRFEAADRLPAPGPRLTLTIRDRSLH